MELLLVCILRFYSFPQFIFGEDIYVLYEASFKWRMSNLWYFAFAITSSVKFL